MYCHNDFAIQETLLEDSKIILTWYFANEFEESLWKTIVFAISGMLPKIKFGFGPLSPILALSFTPFHLVLKQARLMKMQYQITWKLSVIL